MSENLLLTTPKYKTTVTAFGTRREFLYSSGARFSDFVSHAVFLSIPLVAIANGPNPETGRMAVARGVFAIGQRARGFVAIGQLAFGVIAIGQLAFAGLIGIGQLAIAPVAIGQGTIGAAAVGMIGVAGFGLFMIGYAMVGLTANELIFGLIQMFG